MVKASKARRSDLPWHEMAMDLDRAIGKSGLSGSELRAAFEAKFGLSWGIVTRYVSVLKKVRQIAERHDLPTEALLSRGFNTTEIAVRLYDREPGQGLEALKGLREGAMSLSSVRRRLAQAPVSGSGASSRGELLRKRNSEIQAVEQALLGSAHAVFPKDFPKDSKIRWRPPLAFFRRVGFEVVGPGEEILGGIDVLVASPAMRDDPLEAAFAPSVLLSNYLPCFYLVFSPSSPFELVPRAERALLVLGVLSVGLAQVNSDGSVRVHRRPSGGSPGRSELYLELRRYFGDATAV